VEDAILARQHHHLDPFRGLPFLHQVAELVAIQVRSIDIQNDERWFTRMDGLDRGHPICGREHSVAVLREGHGHEFADRQAIVHNKNGWTIPLDDEVNDRRILGGRWISFLNCFLGWAVSDGRILGNVQYLEFLRSWLCWRVHGGWFEELVNRGRELTLNGSKLQSSFFGK